MKRLLILRHAKSSWAEASQDDWQRPLNDRGWRDAPRAGEWLRARGLLPDLTITSDAVRADETAKAVIAALGGTHHIVKHPSLYLATPQAVIDVLREVGGNPKSVMIVGHNPGLEELIHELTGEHHSMPTTALVVIDVPIDRWSELDSSSGASIAESWQPRE